MKIKSIIIAGTIITLFTYSSCKKSKKDIEDPHNHSLFTKNISQIKSEITGKWQVQRYHYSVCGVAGCNTVDYSYPTDKGDFIFFNSNDTVIKVKYDYSLYYIREKALIERIKNTDSSIPSDSIYRYSLQNGFTYWVMSEIKNDTLVINAGPYIYYSIKK